MDSGNEPVSRLRDYMAALGMTGAAGTAVSVVDMLASFPPFLLFALASGVSWVLFGAGPAVMSVVVSALASDYLFLEPRYTFSLNQTTAVLGSAYALGALICLCGARWRLIPPRR
jgi:K+-sensing histidine kinase KdpD